MVEVRSDPAANWRRWRGPLWVAQDECAVYLGGDSLPGEFFQAVIQDNAEVRVTAVVEADVRLTSEQEGDPDLVRRVVEVANRGRWRQVHDVSIFKNAAGVSAPRELDETDLLEALAVQHVEANSFATEANLTLGWVDISFRPGDAIYRIDGQGMDLLSHSGGAVAVHTVRHDFAATNTTQLQVRG